jgi:uncharacterized protein involved in exopolysaccharide biosynthesis
VPPPPPLYVPERPETNAPADLFDWGLIVDAVLFGKNAVARHWFLALFITGVMSGLAAGVSKILPRQYKVETRLLTQRNYIISSLANPGRSIPTEADQPTRSAWEMIMKFESLKSIAHQAKLLEYWDATRSPLSRLKEKVTGKPPKPISDKDKEEILIGMLERAIQVGVEGGSGTVSIGVEWSDPQLALNIVEAAQKNFLDMRQAAEMGAVSEAITILEKQVEDEGQGIQRAIADLNATVKRVEARLRREEEKAAGRKKPDAAASARLLETDHMLAQMRFMIQTKRRAISDVEEFRARRLTELRNQLSEQRVIYSPQHPIITDLEQRIASLQEDSPQLVALRSELNELINEYMRNGGKPAELESGLVSAAGVPMASLGGPTASDSPEVSVAADRVRMLVARHQEKMRRLDQARTELEISRASMKHRFSVLSPAVFPEKPSKPKVQLVVAGGVIGGIFLGIFAALGLDIIRRRILEKWQVERLLGLPVLAQLERR